MNAITIGRVLLLLSCLVSFPCWSWSANGHGDIAIAALDQLPQTALEEYQTVLLAGPWAKGGVSWRGAAVRAAAWPDRVRDMPLRKLFGQYGSGKVPPALQGFRKGSTSDWHYTNALFVDPSGRVVAAPENAAGKSCPPAQEGNLLTVWPALFAAYEQVKDPRDKAIVLAFLLHMVADAYQPLHLLGSLDASCRQDRGGNSFCVAPLVGFQAGLRCRDSLHYLWDQGFGAFSEQVGKLPRFRGDVRELSTAVEAVRRVADQVYPDKPELAKAPAYQSRSREQVKQKARLAAAHLAAALQSLANRK